jgi:hypothetical protein
LNKSGEDGYIHDILNEGDHFLIIMAKRSGIAKRVHTGKAEKEGHDNDLSNESNHP